eukprot:scaffold6440_cov124-Cylindrotheca_fusiformis.AAC.8
MLLDTTHSKAGAGMQKGIRHDLYWLLLLSTPFVTSHYTDHLWFFVVALGAIAFLFLFLLFNILRWPKRRKIARMRASQFNPYEVPKELDTIVIGSGSGGSTCANLLSQSGQRVLVLDQHPTVTGGCTHSFREENCEWDTGLHYTSKDMSRPTSRPGKRMKLSRPRCWSFQTPDTMSHSSFCMSTHFLQAP